jgi:hypothetical protein
MEARHLTMGELEAGLAEVRRAPADGGTVRLIVRRPKPGEREVVERAQLDTRLGLVGDDWLARGCRLTADGAAHPEMQLTIMNARAIALLAVDEERWPLAGDQLYVDMDLSVANLPPLTRLVVGSAVVEVTAEPHTGCKQFAARYGTDAVKFVNSPEGKGLRLRGLNAKVVQSGTVRVGDIVRKLTG